MDCGNRAGMLALHLELTRKTGGTVAAIFPCTACVYAYSSAEQDDHGGRDPDKLIRRRKAHSLTPYLYWFWAERYLQAEWAQCQSYMPCNTRYVIALFLVL